MLYLSKYENNNGTNVNPIRSGFPMLVYTFRLERVKQNIEVYVVIFELQVHVDNHEFKRVSRSMSIITSLNVFPGPCR